MAAPTITKDIPGGVIHVSWALTTADHTGDAVEIPGGVDKVFQAIAGTAGGATIALEGSLNGTNFFSLHDQDGTAIAYTASGGDGVSEGPIRYVRPRLTTVGSGAVWTALVAFRQGAR